MSNEAQNEDVQAAENAAEPAKEAEVEQSETVDASAAVTVDEARIQELEAALAKAEATINDQKDSVLRAKADSDNARRRASAEVEKARKFALEGFAGELLSVVDNLERALQSVDPENEALKSAMEGVEITHKSFVGTLDKFGVKSIDPTGEAFNPEQHQAMSMQESADVAPNTVLAVMQKGYILNDRLLRPAMVVVSRASESGVDVQV